jgi:hypothetical protein
MPVDDPAKNIEADADELEERIEKLDSHIGEARENAATRARDAGPAEDAAGDWEATEGGPLGDDAEGFDDPESEEEEEE